MRPWFKSIGHYKSATMNTVPEIQAYTDASDTAIKALDSSIKEIPSKLNDVTSLLQLVTQKIADRSSEAPKEGFYLRGDKRWQSISKPYYVIKNYYDIFEVRDSSGKTRYSDTLSKLIKAIRNGSINGNNIGDELILMYDDPLNGVMELPFIFSTIQTFVREDGSIFRGLGLLSKYGIPVNGAQFDYKEQNFPSVPAEPEESTEPTEPVIIDTSASRRTLGSNIWLRSNFRQWLNGESHNWYKARYAYDAPPDTPDYTSSCGFLGCLPAEFVDAIIPVKMTTIRNVIDERYAKEQNNALSDDELTPYKEIDTYDKIFLLSTSQMNIRITDQNHGVNGNTEGRYWEYCRNLIETWISENPAGSEITTDEEGYVITDGTDTVSDNCGHPFTDDKMRPIDNQSSSCSFWTRSATLGDTFNVNTITSSGKLQPKEANSTLYAFPACVIG